MKLIHKQLAHTDLHLFCFRFLNFCVEPNKYSTTIYEKATEKKKRKYAEYRNFLLRFNLKVSLIIYSQKEKKKETKSREGKKRKFIE